MRPATSVRKTMWSLSCRLCTPPVGFLVWETSGGYKLLQLDKSRSQLCWPDDKNIQHEVLNQTFAGSAVLQPTGYCDTFAHVLHEKFKFDKAPVGKRRLFIKKLGKDLCQELKEQWRPYASHLGLIRAPLKHVYIRHSGTSNIRGCCQVCPWQTDRKATAVCKACHKNVCPVHCQISFQTCLCWLMEYFPRLLVVSHVHSSVISWGIH